MPTTFEDASAVGRIAEDLIRVHHQYLRQSDIRYLWRYSDSEWTKGGALVYGQTALVSGALRHIAGDADAVVLVNASVWEHLSESQRAALVDHELSHLQPRVNADGDVQSHPDGRPILCLARHDVEEFAAVIRRHGLWRPELERAAAAFREVPLDLEPRETPSTTGEVDMILSAPGMEPVHTNLREMQAVASGLAAGGRRRAAR